MELISQAEPSVWDVFLWENKECFTSASGGFDLFCAVSLSRHWSDIKLTCMLIKLTDFQLPYNNQMSLLCPVRSQRSKNLET